MQVSTIGRIPVNLREYRRHLNNISNQPWDTPLFPAELEAIRVWQATWGVVFVPGRGMALFDAGLEGVR